MNTHVKGEISQHFETKALRKVKLFCGLKIARDRVRRTITVDQEQYNDIILQHFGLENVAVNVWNWQSHRSRWSDKT